MKNSIPVKLAKIHNESNLFSVDDFKRTKENNIIHLIRKNTNPQLEYLKEFYSTYQRYFNQLERNAANKVYARNTDLPFVGKKVLQNKKAKFIFYFEGSLSEKKRLSITVLAHLWLIPDEKIESMYFGKNGFWKKPNYLFTKQKMNLTRTVIENSYIADAVRLRNKSDNKTLIDKEIKLLNPEVVICVGKKSKNLVGMEHPYFRALFTDILFPGFRNRTKIINYKGYQHLNKTLAKF